MSTFTSTNSGVVLSSSLQNPATIVAGAYVTNEAAGYAGDAVYGKVAATWSVFNYGTIKGLASTSSDGVHLTGGGSVTNGNSAAPAQIIASNNAIEIDGGAGRVANYGTIAATGTAGI